MHDDHDLTQQSPKSLGVCWSALNVSFNVQVVTDEKLHEATHIKIHVVQQHDKICIHTLAEEPIDPFEWSSAS